MYMCICVYIYTHLELPERQYVNKPYLDFNLFCLKYSYSSYNKVKKLSRLKGHKHI